MVWVERSHGKQASNLFLFHDSDGTLHLLWAKSLNQGINSDVIRHASSTNEGETWSEPQDVDLPDESIVTDPEAILTPDGTIHLAFAPLGDDLYHTFWRTGDWAPVRKVMEGKVAIDPEFALGPDGETLVLIWSQMSDVEGPASLEEPTAVYSTWPLQP